MSALERLRVCRYWVVFVVVIITCFTACSTKTSAVPDSELAREITSPAPPGSLPPRLTSLPDDSVVLSWLQPQSVLVPCGETDAGARREPLRHVSLSADIPQRRQACSV